jgi:hypothetical protein
MSIHRRFAPIGVRFEPEQVAAFTGIYIFGFLFSLLVTYDLLDMGDFSSFAVVDAAIAFGIGCIWAGIFVKWCDERPNSFIRGSRGRR